MQTETEVYSVYFSAEINAVIMRWNGYATSREFREGTELMLNTLILNKCSNVLADIRNMTLMEWKINNGCKKILFPEQFLSVSKQFPSYNPHPTSTVLRLKAYLTRLIKKN